MGYTTVQDQLAIQALLAERFKELRKRNPSFSLRAFAKKLELSPATLSGLLQGKRRVSKSLASKIVANLHLPEKEAQALLSLFPEKSQKTLASQITPIEFREMSADNFRIISDWHHYAIMSLVELDDYRHEPTWIAQRLNIKKSEAADALERLERLGILKSMNGRMMVAGAPYVTSDDVSEASIRRNHAQCLDLAKTSLENDDVLIRDLTSITMAIDTKKLPAAKKMIRAFRDQLCTFLEAGEKKEVYLYFSQLIPLSRTRSHGPSS